MSKSQSSTRTPALPAPLPALGEPSGRPVSPALRPDEFARLHALRMDLDRRAEGVALIVAGLQRRLPGFARRRMTLRDFRAVCRRDGVAIELRLNALHHGYLSRVGGRPRITLRPNLAPAAAVFTAFHELGHWTAHPYDSEASLRDGTNTRIEQEADSVGYLALVPVPGPPYPVVVSHDWSHRDERAFLDVLMPARRGARLEWERREHVIEPWYAWREADRMVDGGEWE